MGLHAMALGKACVLDGKGMCGAVEPQLMTFTGGRGGLRM